MRLFFLLHLYLFLAVSSAGRCKEQAISHPPPRYDTNRSVLHDAFVHIGTLLDITISDPEYDPTSVSVEITSSTDTLWSYHHTARKRNESRPGITEVNGDALYRIASITKTFTVLGILKQHATGKLNLDDPIDKYVEKLRKKQSGSIPWHDITLRSLASQLSGIPHEILQSDLLNTPSFAPFAPEDVGLPPVSVENLPGCEYSKDYETPCTGDDIVRLIKSNAPLLAPNQQSTYSNVAFDLLGLVLQNTTNQTYDSYVEDVFFKPLNMSKSTLSRPPDSAGVIPLNPHFWDIDLGAEKPTGGMYSSATDLSKYLRYILTHYNGITSSLNWMNIVSPATNLQSFYGMPWEIFQTDRILSDSQRTVRFITKGGGLPGYTSLIILVPEYDLGVTLLLAGPSKYFSKLLEIVTTETVRAAEELAILQLQQLYAGTFTSPDPDLHSTLTLTADHRGLIVEKFISNGTNVIESLTGLVEDQKPLLKVVPTLLYKDEKAKRGERWRFLVRSEPAEEEEQRVWDDFCVTDIDLLSYAGKPWNEFVLWQSENGSMFDDLELSAYRVNLTRIIAQPRPLSKSQAGMEL